MSIFWQEQIINPIVVQVDIKRIHHVCTCFINEGVGRKLQGKINSEKMSLNCGKSKNGLLKMENGFENIC